MTHVEKSRKQQTRSIITRQKLIEATLDALQEYGYHGASLSKILKKAGVSRGAWSHHFKNKNDLVASASEYLLSTALEKSKEVAADLQKRERSISDILDLIWENFYQGRYRDVWIEFNVACRTDRELLTRLKPVISHFFNEMDAIWQSVLTPPASISAENLINLSLYLMRGMALQSISLDRPDHYRSMRAQWSKIITGLIPPNKRRHRQNRHAHLPGAKL